MFVESRGNGKLTAGAPVELLQFSKLRFFWKELGLNFRDLAELNNPEWQEKMWAVHLGLETAKNNVIEQARRASASKSGNKRIEKLL